MPRRRRACPPNRKTDHSVIERRRREKINDRLLHLQRLVPACRAQAAEHFQRKAQDPDDGRMDTDLVLEKLCIISHTVGMWRGVLPQTMSSSSRHSSRPTAPSASASRAFPSQKEIATSTSPLHTTEYMGARRAAPHAHRAQAPSRSRRRTPTRGRTTRRSTTSTRRTHVPSACQRLLWSCHPVRQRSCRIGTTRYGTRPTRTLRRVRIGTRRVQCRTLAIETRCGTGRGTAPIVCAPRRVPRMRGAAAWVPRASRTPTRGPPPRCGGRGNRVEAVRTP